MRPFVTPLFEVSTELNLALEPIVEFRANSFYERIKKRCPKHQQLPLIAIPPEQATPEQLNMTPAVYRFFSEDEKWFVFMGPRIVAGNVRGWPGYGEYRSFVADTFGSYLDLTLRPVVQRHSIGFYNRIPVSSVGELKEILSTPLDIHDDVTLQELLFQTARNTDVGSVLTQMFMMPGDAYTPEPYLAVNNIVRAVGVESANLDLPKILAWLDKAHDVGKDMIWTTLSEKARESWRAASA